MYRDGKKIISTTKNSYTNSDLIPGRKYTYVIRAYDIAGNYSVPSSNISAATLSDNAAPSVPGGLKTSSILETEVCLTWSPSSDNVKVKEYEIFLDGSKIGTTDKTTYSDDGLFA